MTIAGNCGVVRRCGYDNPEWVEPKLGCACPIAATQVSERYAPRLVVTISRAHARWGSR